MGIGQCFLMAFKSISTSKMRSFLTMLGIIIGVAAVIIIMALGNGMTIYMNDMFASLGTTNITVNVFGRGSSRTVDVDDLYEFYEQNKDIYSYMSPTVSSGAEVRGDDGTAHYPTITGVGEDYLDLKDYKIENGRNIEYVDIALYKKFCVVGAYYNEIVYAGDAVGKYLRINGDKYLIIGTVEQQGQELEEYGTDDFVILPYSTAAKYVSWSNEINNFTFKSIDDVSVTEGIERLESRLYETFQSEDFYSVSSLTQMLDEANKMMDTVVLILAAIASISLVVGGIGIMNIMLVSVTERTREIGIRKALGAKGRHIRLQFVIEAATTSALGGIIGILLGIGISTAVSKILASTLQMTAVPSSSSILISFGISAGIGVIFGYLPANKAAKLNPIEALRHN